MKKPNTTFDIKIEDNQVIFSLWQKRGLAATFNFPLDHDLSQKLLVLADQFLKKNKLEVEDIKVFKFSGGTPESYTSYRIIQATVEALNLVNKKAAN